MALAHSQAYSFRHFSRAYNGTQSDWLPAKEFVYEWKEGLKASGWTVMGSYDGQNSGNIDSSGITANVDGLGGGAGVDYWVSPTAIDTSNSSHDPWIVLQCPPTQGDVQICIGLNRFGGGTGNTGWWDIVQSPLGQFFAANGGADGGTNTLPTAPDQLVEQSDVAYITSAHDTYEIHTAWSADKSQMIIFSQCDLVISNLWIFSKLSNAESTLDNATVWTTISANMSNGTTSSNDPEVGVGGNSDHYTSSKWRGLVSGTSRIFYLGGRGFNNVGIQSQYRTPDSGKVLVGPCELYPSNVAIGGFFGTVPDVYWGPERQYNTGLGDAVDGLINWYQLDALIVPWDNTQRLPRTR